MVTTKRTIVIVLVYVTLELMQRESLAATPAEIAIVVKAMAYRFRAVWAHFYQSRFRHPSLRVGTLIQNDAGGEGRTHLANCRRGTR